jgi:uncharacterized protein YdeI (YjbR/CyaY-like superfamily)
MWCIGGAVKVPYAKKWQKEADKLRKIALDCDLSEEMKWGKPCFTYQKKNVAIVIPLKDACALSFFKGALLNDPKHILQKIGEHTQAGRWIKFTSLKEITAVQSILRSYIQEAIKVEESGKKVTFKKAAEFAVPEELQARLDAAPKRATLTTLPSERIFALVVVLLMLFCPPGRDDSNAFATLHLSKSISPQRVRCCGAM